MSTAGYNDMQLEKETVTMQWEFKPIAPGKAQQLGPFY